VRTPATEGLPVLRKPTRGTPLLIGVFLLVAGSLYLLAQELRRHGMSDAADLAQLLSYPFAFLPVLGGAVQHWRAGRRPPVATPDDLAAIRTHLAMLLTAQWRIEARLRSLDDPDPIPVPWALDDGEVVFATTDEGVAELVERFREMRRPRLLVLGDAGSGKTTLAVQVLLRMLATRGPDDPVPVLLSVTGWDPKAKPQLEDWLAQRIVRGYPDLAAAGREPHQVRALVEHRMIVPILDGLDEAPPDARSQVIDALNAWLDGETQLMMTCRSEEYEEAGELRGASVLSPHPLTPFAAAGYLERCLPSDASPEWTSILDRLRSGEGALSLVATTPLGLWLIRVAYISPRADPAALLNGARFAEAGSLRRHLLDRLIPASVRARPPSDRPADLFRPRLRYEPADVERWLGFLATNLDRRETRDFDLTSDMPALAAPARWPAATVRFLNRWMPVIRTSVAELAGGRRWRVIAMGLVVLLALIGVGSAFTTIAAGVLRLVLPSSVSGAAAPLVGIAAAFGVAAAGATMVVADFELWEVTREWYRRREGFLRFLPDLTYALLWFAIAGVVCAVVTRSRGVSMTVAFCAVAIWVALQVIQRLILFEDAAPAGAGRRAAWYGWSPLAGLSRSLFWGIFLGLIAAVLLADPADPFQNALIAVALPVLATTPLVLLFAVVLPITFSVAGAIEGTIRLFGGRGARRPPADDPDLLARLWRFEAWETLLRFIRLGLVAVFLAIPLTLAARATGPFVSGGIDSFLAAHGGPFDFHWHGQLRYVIAVAAAWLATYRFGRRRSWRLWLVWLGTAAVVVLLLGYLRPDDAFDLRLNGLLNWPDVHLSAQAFGHHGAGTIGLSKLLDDQGAQTILFLIVLVWGAAALISVVSTVEGRPSRLWWSATVAGWWHTRRGRLPRDLARFLDDAHRLGLLRAVGTVYQFRHAELQDHLARRTPSATDSN
jgi:hypothetical protein